MTLLNLGEVRFQKVDISWLIEKSKRYQNDEWRTLCFYVKMLVFKRIGIMIIVIIASLQPTFKQIKNEWITTAGLLRFLLHKLGYDFVDDITHCNPNYSKLRHSHRYLLRKSTETCMYFSWSWLIIADSQFSSLFLSETSTHDASSIASPDWYHRQFA